MAVRLTVYLIDGTREYVEKDCDEWDVIRHIKERAGLLVDDTWYPLHAILKLRIEWSEWEAYAERPERKRKKGNSQADL